MSKSPTEKERGLFGKLKGYHEDMRQNRMKEQQEKRVTGAIHKEKKRNAFLANALMSSHEANDVVATVKVSKLGLRSIAPKCKYETYVRVAVEGSHEATSRISEIDGVKKFDESFEIPVQDIATDLTLSIYGKAGKAAAVYSDHFLGKVVIPLSRFYKGIGIQRMFMKSHNKFSFESWYTIYPLKEERVHYEPVVTGLPGTGMDQGDPLGDLYCEVTLQLDHGLSVAGALLLNPPFKPVGEFELTEFEAKELRLGVLRCKKSFASLKSFISNCVSLASWSVPGASCVVLIWWTYFCLYASVIEMPFLLSVMLVFLHWTFPHRDDDVTPLIWNHEIELDPNIPNTIMKKLRLLSKLLIFLQKTFNKVAFKLERLAAMLNWVDTPLSVMFSICFILAGIVGSFVVGIMVMIETYFLPLYVVIYLTVVTCFLPINFGMGGEAPKKEKTPSIYASGFANLCARLPDEKELVHRRIARSQEKPY